MRRWWIKSGNWYLEYLDQCSDNRLVRVTRTPSEGDSKDNTSKRERYDLMNSVNQRTLRVR